MDIAKELKTAIAHRIACIERPYINGFAGTSRSKRRTAGDIHALARAIMNRTFDPFSFYWNIGNQEPAGFSDIYLVVFTTLFDIDDEDARRWSSKTEHDIARHEAAADISRALARKFIIAKRGVIMPKGDGTSPGFGDPSASHSITDSRYEDERSW